MKENIKGNRRKTVNMTNKKGNEDVKKRRRHRRIRKKGKNEG
jgi:hypothetical protein